MVPEDGEKPLDPAMLRVEARVKRLFLIGGLTLAVGLAAVLAAIVYRVGKAGTGSPSPPAAVRVLPALSLPSEAKLVGTDAAGERIALTYAVGRDTLVVFVDAQSGAVVSQLWLRPEP